MSSFLKIFPRPKSEEAVDAEGPGKGVYIPMDALDLTGSIAAQAGNLSLNCKSCCRSSKNSPERRDDSQHFFSGLLGIISKNIFMVYQVDLNYSEPFSYKNVQNIEIPVVNDNPLLKPSITLVSEHIILCVFTENVIFVKLWF